MPNINAADSAKERSGQHYMYAICYYLVVVTVTPGFPQEISIPSAERRAQFLLMRLGLLLLYGRVDRLRVDCCEEVLFGGIYR